MSREFQINIKNVEQWMLQFYGIKATVAANDFLISKHELEQQDAEAAKLRATTLFVEKESDDFFIGLYLSDAIKTPLSRPLRELSTTNLDAFLVLVEELSHFHLICRRAGQRRSLTLLELEWQAEIDKLLFATLILKNQEGRWLHQEIGELLYREAQLIHADRKLYEEASALAERFWQEMARHLKMNPFLRLKELQMLLRANYESPWHEKIPLSLP